jgi:hypothetical protein
MNSPRQGSHVTNTIAGLGLALLLTALVGTAALA